MRVLAIGAHPDDIEITCAGTLIKCAKRGDEVFACHLSDGDMGHVEIMPEELGKIRREEARKAGSLAGFTVIWGGFHDLDIYPENREARDKIVDIIREVQPDFIITHNPDDYMPDHTATSKLVFDASFTATVPHYPTKCQTIPRVVPIYYMESNEGMGFEPTDYVDISEEMELKHKMFVCHESQVKWLMDHDGVDTSEKMETFARFHGYQCGVKYAEVFRRCVAGLKMTPERLLP